MKNSQLQFAYNIQTERGPVLKPVHFEFHDLISAKISSQKALKYHADVLLGCSFLALNPTSTFKMKKQATQLWSRLEPHVTLYHECQNRVKAMAQKSKPISTKLLQEFEKKFNDSLASALDAKSLDLKEITGLIDTIHFFESEAKTPLLYNFSCQFSTEFAHTLQAFESFLFHLRNIIAIDYNSHIEDASHEALKVDSITDYLPKGDYVVSDAVLYWNFRRLFTPFVAGSKSDVRLEKLLYQPLQSSFEQYAHNATCLIQNLPESFLNALKPSEIEDALYLVQMDWLLGTPSGLLFKLREELYGLQEGYEKIFWQDLAGKPTLKQAQLSLEIHMSEKDLQGLSAA